MGVKITSRNYSELFTQGISTWLLGNVGEWQKLTIECEASVDFFPSQSESVVIDTVQKTFTLQNGKKWSDYGFDIGQQVVFSAHYIFDRDSQGVGPDDEDFVVNQTVNIINIYDSTIEVSEDIETHYDLFTLPSNYGNKTVDKVSFKANIEPEGVAITYGHISNADAENGNLYSVIDGTTTKFVQPNVKGQPVVVPFAMEAVGLQSGMSIRNCLVTRLGVVVIGTTPTNRYKYRVELEFLISSFFESIATFEEKLIPEYLSGIGSLTDNFKLVFYPKWNNPNALIQNDLNNTERLGNTGWFNENFNQLQNDYSVDSLSYSDENGNPISGIDYFATTRVTAIIRNVSNVTADTHCGFGFMWVPKYEEDYKNNEIPFYRNTFINTGEGSYNVNEFYPDQIVGGGVGSAWMEVKNVQFKDLGGGNVSFEAFFTPSPDFYLLFDDKDTDDKNYILWLSVADRTLIRNFSDRVSLLLDYNLMIKSVPPAGPYPYIQNAFIEHPYAENVTGVEQYDGFIQDDVLCRVPFQVDPAITQIRKFRFGIEIYNASKNERVILEKYDVDMTSFYSDVNGVPQYNLNATRGFKLGDNNNKNWVKINKEAGYDSAGKYGYIGYYGFKIRWEDWIALSGLPNDFFSPTDLNNGFNNDWYHLMTAAGWRFNLLVEIDAVVDTELVQYRNRWDFKFKDYDSNVRIQTAHKYFRDSDNTFLNIGTDPETGKPLGVVLSNEPTRLEIDYHILDAGTWDITKVYATATIEVDKGPGFMQMRQISSVWGSEPDNPLIPLQGETLLKITVDGTLKTLTTKCLIDPDLLEGASRYRITGRVGCYDNNGVITFGIYEGRYEYRYE